jgi:hypothetical protein
MTSFSCSETTGWETLQARREFGLRHAFLAPQARDALAQRVVGA